jgi:general secretion pathway protein F
VLQIAPAGNSFYVRFQAWRTRPKMSTADLALVTRQLATLLEASLPLDETLSAVSRQAEKKVVSTLMADICNRVREGFSLAQALQQFPAVFDRLFCSMVAAGEATGQLPLILTQLADYVEQRQKVKSKITQAMTYPVVLTLVSVAVVSLLLTLVVPQVTEQFIHMKQALPTSTRILVSCSDALREYGVYLLAGFITMTGLARRALKKDSTRRAWHRRLLTLPVLGKLVVNVNTARYAHTLSILCTSAVPLLESMKISASVLDNDYARERLMQAMEQVKEGGSLYQALEETELFSPMMRHMIASGERSGELGPMLQRAAGMQQEVMNQRITLTLTLFEPALVVTMAIIVLLIVMAILQPLLQLNSMLG